MTRAARTAAWTAAGLAPAAAAALAFALWWRGLPDPMAVHWGLGGRPDWALPRSAAAVALVGPAVTFGVGAVMAVAWPSAMDRSPGRTSSRWPAIAVGLSAVFAWSSWLAVIANRGVADWRHAGRVTILALLPGLVLAMALAAAVWRLAPRGPAVGDERPPPSLGLGADEHAAWTGRAHASWWLTALLVALGLVLALLSRSAGALVGVVVLVVVALAFWSVRVTVDRRGLRVRYGRLPWPVTRIPLSEMRRADAIDLRPMDWGGWGYRGGRRAFGRAAVVLRAGEAIRVELADGGVFAVTVDDALTGAGLLNDLRQRCAETPNAGT